MPSYVYECREHGTFEVEKPMALSGETEWCRHCDWPMRRIYTPQGFIMRPSGYNRRPGDPNYADFRRELELGEIREPGDTDLHGKVEDEVLPPDELPEPDPRHMQRIHELGRAVDRQIREEMTLPSKILDLVER
jgi:predicted nucleic acid-binding Zn ribbon protein